VLEGRESVIPDTSCARFIYARSLPTVSHFLESPKSPNTLTWKQTSTTDNRQILTLLVILYDTNT